VSKFVGKFRKNKNYNDDYNYDVRRHRDEHGEIKKLLSQSFHEYALEDDDFGEDVVSQQQRLTKE
jgi:hypothetical protein